MQKLQILFPDPLLDMLRRLAKAEDLPVSEIVRRAVDRDVNQRAALLMRERDKVRKFPTFNGGAVLVGAHKMKSLIHADDA